MLPIDGNAKTSKPVLLCSLHDDGSIAMAALAEWKADPEDEVEGGDWIEVGTGLNVHFGTHYLPAPYLEHASAMRAELAEMKENCGYRHRTLELLAATEWPITVGQESAQGWNMLTPHPAAPGPTDKQIAGISAHIWNALGHEQALTRRWCSSRGFERMIQIVRAALGGVDGEK